MVRRNFRGADERSKQELGKALDDMLAAYPGIEPSAVVVAKPQDDEDGGTYGETDNKTGEIRIAPKYAKDFEGWRKDMRQACTRGNALRKDLAKVVDNPARYTLVHEYGHVVGADLIGRLDFEDESGDEGYRRMCIGAWRQVAPDSVPEDADTEPVPMIFALGIYNAEVAADLSAYANASPQELVAEAFAVYHTCGRGKSKIADYVHDELERLYVAKHGPRSAAPAA